MTTYRIEKRVDDPLGRGLWTPVAVVTDPTAVQPILDGLRAAEPEATGVFFGAVGPLEESWF